MARINRRYFSLSAIVFGKVDRRAYSQTKADQMLGSLQPAATAFRDFKQTFKPYRSLYQLFRDIFQVFRGVLNTILGALKLVIFMDIGIGMLGTCLILSPLFLFPSSRKWVGPFMAESVVLALSWNIEAALQLIQGITQVLTAPLVLVTKVPLRLVLTALEWRNNGLPLAEHNPRIQYLSQKLETRLNHSIINVSLPTPASAPAHVMANATREANPTLNITLKQKRAVKELLYSYERARDRWQHTKITRADISLYRHKLHTGMTVSEAFAFNGLFNMDQNDRNNEEDLASTVPPTFPGYC